MPSPSNMKQKRPLESAEEEDNAQIEDEIMANNAQDSETTNNEDEGNMLDLKDEESGGNNPTEANHTEMSGTEAGADHTTSSSSKKLKPGVPPKKPHTAWLIFLSEHRDTITRENPSFSMTDVTKKAGEMYRALRQEEKNRLEALVKEAKARYEKELEEYQSLHGDAANIGASGGGMNGGSGGGGRGQGSSNTTAKMTRGRNGSRDAPLEALGKEDLAVPLARVLRTMKMDPEVGKVSKDATLLIAKAMELFVGQMTLQGGQAALERNARSITDMDIIRVIHTQPALDFLRLDFPRLSKKGRGKSTPSSSNDDKKSTSPSAGAGGAGVRSSASAGNGNGNRSVVMTGPGAISSFFQPIQSNKDKDNKDKKDNKDNKDRITDKEDIDDNGKNVTVEGEEEEVEE